MQNVTGISNGGSNVVGDHNNGNAVLPVELFNQRIHLRHSLGVKPGNRFVQEQHFLCGAQRTGKQYPLLLPAG